MNRLLNTTIKDWVSAKLKPITTESMDEAIKAMFAKRFYKSNASRCDIIRRVQYDVFGAMDSELIEELTPFDYKGHKIIVTRFGISNKDTEAVQHTGFEFYVNGVAELRLAIGVKLKCGIRNAGSSRASHYLKELTFESCSMWREYGNQIDGSSTFEDVLNYIVDKHNGGLDKFTAEYEKLKAQSIASLQEIIERIENDDIPSYFSSKFGIDDLRKCKNILDEYKKAEGK